MDARRDALAHRFIARTADETRAWPPLLQVTLHQLAFVALPELVLALDEDAARRWARGWRERMDQQLAAVDPADAVWVATLSREWPAARRAASEAEPSPREVARLAELIARLGPVALALPWRDERGEA